MNKILSGIAWFLIYTCIVMIVMNIIGYINHIPVGHPYKEFVKNGFFIWATGLVIWLILGVLLRSNRNQTNIK